MKRRALDAVVRRVADDGNLVLRGSLLLSRWCPARQAEDVDFVGLGELDAVATQAEVEARLARELGDGVRFGAIRGEIIWADTARPGLRLRVAVDIAGSALEVQADVGFGDPMVPPPEWLDWDGVRVLACRPESLFAWKVHALYERGPGRWRPKDLWDLCLIARHAPLDLALLPVSLATAFESRGDSLELTAKLVAGNFGHSPWSLDKWQRFRDAMGPERDPGALVDAVTEVRRTLAPLLPPATTPPTS